MVSPYILTDKSRPVTPWLVLQGLICKNVFKFFCSLSCHLHANILSALLSFDYINFIFGILQIQHVKGSQRAWFWCSVLTTLTILYILFCVESNKVPLVNFPNHLVACFGPAVFGLCYCSPCGFVWGSLPTACLASQRSFFCSPGEWLLLEDTSHECHKWQSL